MQMVQVAREAQVHHVGGLVRRKKIAPAPVAQVSLPICYQVAKLNLKLQDKIVCDREDMTFDHYGETWAAYKLASVVGALAATNKSSVVVVGGGHGHVSLFSQYECCFGH
jgi:23S rRNA pseudoU1915 N3-methylase RlmH